MKYASLFFLSLCIFSVFLNGSVSEFISHNKSDLESLRETILSRGTDLSIGDDCGSNCGCDDCDPIG